MAAAAPGSPRWPRHAAIDGTLDVGVEALLDALRVELDVDAGAAPTIGGEAADGGSQPEVVEDHGPDLEDEILGRVEGLLHEPAQRLDLFAGTRVVLLDEPLDDLGLQADVGDGLCRAVVELAHDVPAQIFLAAHDHGRLVQPGRAAAAGCGRQCP